MITVYRPSDRVRVRAGELELELRPLTVEQKQELAGYATLEGAQSVSDIYKMAMGGIQYGVTAIKGISYPDGTEAQVELDEKGLTAESLDLVMQALDNQLAIRISNKLLKSISDMDDVEGIELVADEPKVKSKKK